jgi:lipopolysaccharide/colanic/teichoic acid biosynthesis glycosyltransferase
MSHVSAKRLLDIVGSAVGLVVFVPLGLLIALLLKLSDRGSVFYSQIRIGQCGKPFRIWKFRSMVPDADKVGVPLTSGEDPRITPFGRLLRRSKLDELPQLWNVLKGEMSFVGPRPEVPRYVERYTAEQREILKHKPGITDVATLLFRNEQSLLNGTADLEDFYQRYCLPKKIELNQAYARQATVVQDIWIILRTICPYWLGMLVIYFACLSFSFWLTYQLRSDFGATHQDYAEFVYFLSWIVVPQLIFLVWRGQLRGLFSYFSIPEMRKTVAALFAALLVQMGLCYLIPGRLAPTRSILLMDFILSFFTLCTVRMFFRLLRENYSRARPNQKELVRRVAMIGTGELATNLALDFARSENPGRRVVAFFDDDARNWHKRPYDIPVVGMPECLLSREWQEKIDEVVVTLPEENGPRIEEICAMLKDMPMKVTIVSGWPMLRTVAQRDARQERIADYWPTDQAVGTNRK